MKYIYPAVFRPEKSGGYAIFFPDIPDCFSQGETISECMFMAEDAASIVLCNCEDNRLAINKPIPGYKSENPDDIVNLISIDTDQYRRKQNIDCTVRNTEVINKNTEYRAVL